MPKLATAARAMFNGRRVLIVTATLLAMSCLTGAQAEDFKPPFLSHAYFEQQEKERQAIEQAYKQEVQQHRLKLLRAQYSAASLRYRQMHQWTREDAERKQLHQTLLALPNGEVVGIRLSIFPGWQVGFNYDGSATAMPGNTFTCLRLPAGTIDFPKLVAEIEQQHCPGEGRCQDSPSVFIIRKGLPTIPHATGDLDIPLAPGLRDTTYLRELLHSVESSWENLELLRYHKYPFVMLPDDPRSRDNTHYHPDLFSPIAQADSRLVIPLRRR